MKRILRHLIRSVSLLYFLFCSHVIIFPAIWEYAPIKIERGELPPVIYHRDTSSTTTICQLFIRSGKSSVPIEMRGLAYITLRMGMESPYPTDIRERYRMGSQMSWNVYGDHSVITIKCLSKHFDKTIGIFFKNFLKPFLSSIRIDLVKENMIFQKQMETDIPERFANLTAQNVLLGPLGHSGSIYGNKASLACIKKAEIENHYSGHITRSNLICSVSSDLELKSILKILEPHLKKIPNPDKVPPHHTSSELHKTDQKHYFFKRDKKQTLLAFSNTFDVNDPKNFLYPLLFETLLGKGVGSRLWELRSLQLSYHPSAQIELFNNGGLLMIYLKTMNHKKESAFNSLKKILHIMYQDGITEEELLLTKTYFYTVFMREIEEKEERTLRFAQFEALGLGYEAIINLPELLEQVSISRFNRFTKMVLDPSRSVQIIVGPVDIEKPTIQAP